MNLKIVSLDIFNKDVKRLYKKYKKLSIDLTTLKDTLQKNPRAGIELGNNCYKLRLANSSIPTGKSGGFRVIYYYLDNQKNIFLLIMYSKAELENVRENRLIGILKNNGLV